MKRPEECNCMCANNCFRTIGNRSGPYNSLSHTCAKRNCRFNPTINSASFISATGLALQENRVEFNEKQTQLTVRHLIIPFYDTVDATIMVTGENKNGEIKSMVTKVVAVTHKDSDTLLKVSNKGLNARGKTAVDFIHPFYNFQLPTDVWINASISILNNMDFDNNDISPTSLFFQNPAHINIINKNDRTFSLTLTLDDGNKRAVMEKDNIITTMTQKNMLKKIKDDNEVDVFKVVTMSFNGKAGLALIKEVKVLKNSKYRLYLITDKKNFSRLSDNATINKLTYTKIDDKVKTQSARRLREFLRYVYM
jgi:hypothetical protein